MNSTNNITIINTDNDLTKINIITDNREELTTTIKQLKEYKGDLVKFIKEGRMSKTQREVTPRTGTFVARIEKKGEVWQTYYLEDIYNKKGDIYEIPPIAPVNSLICEIKSTDNKQSKEALYVMEDSKGRKVGITDQYPKKSRSFTKSDTKIQCRYGLGCTRTNCSFLHSTILCRFGKECKNTRCRFRHPFVSNNKKIFRTQERKPAKPLSNRENQTPAFNLE